MSESLRPNQSPQFIIDEAASDEARQALEYLKEQIIKNPEAAEASLNFFMRNPDSAITVVDFLLSQPEAFECLSAWRQIIPNRYDRDVEFDPATEEAIASDPEFLAAGKADGRDAEAIRDRKRARRFGVVISRAKKLDETPADAGAA